MDKNSVSDHALLDAIKVLSSNGDTGRLEILAEATRGAFFFKEGKLVHAHVGGLNGFQAVNAALSIRNARFNFDPLVPPPTLSSITANERVVLKRFFGIETVEAQELNQSVPAIDVDWDLTPSQVVPLTEVPEFGGNDPEEIATIELEELRASGNEQTPSFTDEIPHINAHNSSPSRHRVGLYVVVLLLVTAAVTFALVRKMNELRQARLMAKASDSAPIAAPEQVNTQAPVDTPAIVVPQPQSKQVSTDSSPSAVTREPQNKQVATDSQSLPVTEQQTVQREPENSTSHNLTGEWKVVNTVEKTRYRSYENLEMGFRLVINQSGREFTAKGEKISENGRILPPAGRTPIHMTGFIDGDTVQATFFEQGALRQTNGRFVWRIQKSGAGLKGTFATTAARSQGRSAATKEL